MNCMIKIDCMRLSPDKPQNYIYSNNVPIFYIIKYLQYGIHTELLIDKRIGMNFTFPTFTIKDDRFGIQHKIKELAAKLAHTAGYYGIVKVLIDSGTKSLSYIDNQGQCELLVSIYYVPYDDKLVTTFQATPFDSPQISAAELFNIPNEVDINQYYKDISLQQMQDTLLIMQVMGS